MLTELSTTRGAWHLELEPQPEHGWSALATLPDAIPALVAELQQRLGGCEIRVAAAALQLGLAARLCNVTVGPVLAASMLPDASGLLWRSTPAGVMLAAGSLTGVSAARPEDLFDAVVSDALPVHAGIIDAIRATVHISAGLLWGNVASALSGVARVLELDGGLLLPALLAHGPLAGHMNDGRRARTCCLFYRVMPGAGVCGDCTFDSAPAIVKR